MFSFSEREQLPPVPVGAGASHNVPADLRRQVLARVQADPHGPQAGEHPLRHLRLGDFVQPEEGFQRHETHCSMKCILISTMYNSEAA